MLQDQALLAELDRIGYFPQVVADALDTALSGEQPEDFYVHPDVAFGVGTIGQHLTVMVLTPTRLITAHIDDHASDEMAPAAVAASTEGVSLRRITSVTLTRITGQPSSPGSNEAPGIVRLSIDWGSSQSLDFEPAGCADPDCIADHGYSGSLTSEDMTLQVATDVNGQALADKLTDFARKLYAAQVRVA
jgi:hypothetical protein